MPRVTTPDVVVLAAAARVDHPLQAAARAWLEGAVDTSKAGSTFKLLLKMLTSFRQLVTSLKISRHAPLMRSAGR